MGRRLILFLLVLLTAAAGAAQAQDSNPSQQERKVVRRVTPAYPDLAKRMGISGIVKLRVTVASNGSVKLIEPVGGNPVLIKAAHEAVTNWKYVSAADETRESIEIRFDPK